MSEEHTQEKERLNELFHEEPDVVCSERKSDLDERLESSDEAVWQDAFCEVHEIWIDVLKKIAERDQDSEKDEKIRLLEDIDYLRHKIKVLYSAVKYLIKKYPSAGISTPTLAILSAPSSVNALLGSIELLIKKLNFIKKDIKYRREDLKHPPPSITDV